MWGVLLSKKEAHTSKEGPQFRVFKRMDAVTHEVATVDASE